MEGDYDEPNDFIDEAPRTPWVKPTDTEETLPSSSQPISSQSGSSQSSPPPPITTPPLEDDLPDPDDDGTPPHLFDLPSKVLDTTFELLRDGIKTRRIPMAFFVELLVVCERFRQLVSIHHDEIAKHHVSFVKGRLDAFRAVNHRSDLIRMLQDKPHLFRNPILDVRDITQFVLFSAYRCRRIPEYLRTHVLSLDYDHHCSLSRIKNSKVAAFSHDYHQYHSTEQVADTSLCILKDPEVVPVSPLRTQRETDLVCMHGDGSKRKWAWAFPLLSGLFGEEDRICLVGEDGIYIIA
ncbi:hypothetical protein HK097_011214 [Rhizophlyctis rosea]|uniref:Uncharacterized protein n=1 Tax=Rhizophlyctis rosea TaxID=64517 RepID=A0AAD5SK14_9FUNG|nr:hypothetical protein HK097_011214 [Rhizophlyctis rosea]